MTRLSGCLSALLLMLLFSASAASASTLIVASDLHYLAPTLNDKGEYITRVLEEGDGKVTLWCEELVDAFFSEVIEQHPTALVLTGDLTFNGALQSHRALAAKLRRVKDAGIPVLVLTGNHDIRNRNAAMFHGNSFTRLQQTQQEDFAAIYGPYGLEDALSCDSASLSYMYQLDDTHRILMLDMNTESDPCGLPQDTITWVEEQLQAARDAGQTVIAAGHQNVLRHSLFNYGYVINRADQLLSLFSEYDVQLVMSGHLHIQHIREEAGVTEITTSAMSVTPCHYGVLTLEGDRIAYEAAEVDVSAWARKNGRTEPELLDFAGYARDFMDAKSVQMCPPLLTGLDVDADQIVALTEYACRMNRAYFSGDMRDVAEMDPDGSLLALWQQAGGFFAQYLASIAEEAGTSMLVWDNGR